MKDLIKRFIDCNVPTQACNLKCEYCYVGQVDGFSGQIEPIEHSPAEVREALSKKRMGGIIFINFCGTGETLLGDDILPIVQEVLKEGHYVQIVTNGVINKRFEEISGWDRELLERLFIKFSYHYTELKRLKKLDDFFDNIIRSRKAGCSISVEITSGDKMTPYIGEMKQICMDRLGALPHVTVARDNTSKELSLLTKYSEKEYADIWGGFHSELFDLKMKLYREKRDEYCYGGEWTFYLHLSNGDLKQCYKGEIIDNIFEDVTRPIRFRPIGRGCREPYCYNGHAWMTLGCIPGMDIPTYADMRNRVTADGEEWLTKKAREFFSHKLEENNITYEDVSKIPKVLLLGDSISKGYREMVSGKLAGKADVYYTDEIATYSTHILRYIHDIAEKLSIGSNLDVVYFNVGLWDVLRIDGDEPLVSQEEYKRNLQRIVKRMKTLFPNAQIIFATITPVLEELAGYEFLRLNEDIDIYNRIACGIMRQNDVLIHDLHQIACENLGGDYIDFTHFSEDGYRILADQAAAYILCHLPVDAEKAYDQTAVAADEKIQNDIGVLSQKRIVIYGAGDYGERVFHALHVMGIKPYVFCDRSKKKQGQTVRGMSVISPEKYIDDIGDSKTDLVIIAIKDLRMARNMIQRFSDENGLTVCTYKIFCSLDIWD